MSLISKEDKLEIVRLEIEKLDNVYSDDAAVQLTVDIEQLKIVIKLLFEILSGS